MKQHIHLNVYDCGWLCFKVSDELAAVQQQNKEDEASYRTKKKTIDLLPDAENNLAKLQVS